MTDPAVNPVEFSEPQGTDFQISQEPVSAPPKRTLPSAGRRAKTEDKTDSPPRSRRTRKSAPKDESGPAKNTDAPEYTPGRIGEGMTGIYAQIGMGLGMFDPSCGELIMKNAVAMGNSMERLAKESPATRAVLEKLITTSAWGEVIAAHMPVILGISMHHVPALRNRLGAQGSGETGVPGNPDMPGSANNGEARAA